MFEHLVSIWHVLQVVLGVGLIIFVHELGHFLVARRCGVRVDVFSLGFGPRLLAWRPGATTYQVAAVPLGGYVKMAGEEWSPEPREPRPDELPAKSVGARFLIFSGGVIANVVFGLVVFPILFAVGVPFHSPLIGEPLPGSPLWQADLEPGTRVLAVNGNEVLDFNDILSEVALGPSDECLLEVLEPGAENPRQVRVRPAYDEQNGMYAVGFRPPSDPLGRVEIERGGPAEAAGLRDGDRILEVEGALPGRGLQAQINAVFARHERFVVRVERDGEVRTVVIEPEVERRGRTSRLGVITPENHLVALRSSERTRALPLQVGDRLLAIDGRPVHRADDLLRGLLAADGPARLVVTRSGARLEPELPALSADQAAALFADLALRNDPESTVLTVSPGDAAALAGVLDGDRVLHVDGVRVERFEDIRARIEAAVRDERAVVLSLERAGDAGPRFLELAVTPLPTLEPRYGISLLAPTYVFRADGPLEALRIGVASCWKFVEQALLTVEGIVRADVSGKNMGGIITIGVVAHSFAMAGWAKFFFFLCILSMNLAFLNVLPIPLLDGGHLMFLLIEKVKGSPVSERVMSYSQLVGLVFIVTLFVYVIYNDVQRFLPAG